MKVKKFTPSAKDVVFSEPTPPQRPPYGVTLLNTKNTWVDIALGSFIGAIGGYWIASWFFHS